MSLFDKFEELIPREINPDQPAGLNYPPNIRDLYDQLLDPERAESEFYNDLNLLIKRMQHYFEKGAPLFFKEVWQKRKAELEHLNTAINTAQISNDYLPLVVLCQTIASQKENYLVSWYNWNGLPGKLKTLLNNYCTDQAFIKSLIPAANDNELRRQYYRLYCDHQSQYLQLKKAGDKLSEMESQADKMRAKDDCSNEPTYKGDYYLRLLGLKDITIKQLTEEKINLEHDKKAMILAAQGTSDLQLDEIKRLREELKRLETALSEDKSIVDENKLLSLRIERLTKEHKLLCSTKKTEGDELHAAKEKIKKLQTTLDSTVSENRELKLNLSSVSSCLQSKTQELVLLKARIADVKKRLSTQQELEIEKFTQATSQTELDVTMLSTQVSLALETINGLISDLPSQHKGLVL